MPVGDFGRGLVFGIVIAVGIRLMLYLGRQYSTVPDESNPDGHNHANDLALNIQCRLRNQRRHGRLHHHGNHPDITAIEARFFRGMSNRASLSEADLQNLKRFVDGEDRTEQVEGARDLAELLVVMRNRELFAPGRYRLILNILRNAGLDVPRMEVHIVMLEDAVNDVCEGFVPRDFEADPFELDAVIIHAEEDRLEAHAYKRHLEEDIGVQDLSVQTYEEYNPRETRMQGVGNVFGRSRFLFVFVTENLSRDSLMRFLTEMALTDGLTDPVKANRIIPVWATNARQRLPELLPLRGVRYWDFQHVQGMRDVYVSNIQTLFVEGRAEILLA